MRVAVLADDLGPDHPVALVLPQLDVLQVGRLGETGPSSARIKFGIGREELLAATYAYIGSATLICQ
jgi:hypothetical protein